MFKKLPKISTAVSSLMRRNDENKQFDSNGVILGNHASNDIGEITGFNEQWVVSGLLRASQNGVVSIEVIIDENVVAVERVVTQDSSRVNGIAQTSFSFCLRTDAIVSVSSKLYLRVDGQFLARSGIPVLLDDKFTIKPLAIKDGSLQIQCNGWPGKSLKGRLFVDGLFVEELFLERNKKAHERIHPDFDLQLYWPLPDKYFDAIKHVYIFDASLPKQLGSQITWSPHLKFRSPFGSCNGIHDAESDADENGVWISNLVEAPVQLSSFKKWKITGTHSSELIALQSGDPAIEVSVFLGSQLVAKKEIYLNGDFAIDFDLPEAKFPTGVQKISIKTDKFFCPLSIEVGNDHRSLAWRLKLISVDDVRVFDCHSISSCLNNNRACSDASQIAYPDYKLVIEHADFSSITGWCYRLDSTHPIQLSLYENKLLLTNAIANTPREDVKEAIKIHQCNTGFNLHFNAVSPISAGCFDLVDAQTKILIAQISVGYSFDLLNELGKLAAHTDISDAARSVFSTTMLNASGDPQFAVTKFPILATEPIEETIAVIIPVYGGFLETVECIESVLKSKNHIKSQIIIINDCSPDSRIEQYLHSIDGHLSNVKIIHRTINAGFSESVNTGMLVASRQDVVLLNADTVVQDGWLDKICAIARSDIKIATVTPFTNNGEICSVPYICESRPVITQQLAKEIDQTLERANDCRALDIPVAIGFCMFIRRACLDEIGLFDAELWGRGYGEEVDFCLKAKAKGWRHVIACDTFVVHRGNISFGEEKFSRIVESAKKISTKYPFYDAYIQRFLASDPIAKARRAFSIKLLPGLISERCVLHISHAYGGGTDQYINDLVSLYREQGIDSVILRFHTNGSAVLAVDVTNSRFGAFFASHHTEKYSHDEVQNSDLLKNDLLKFKFEKAHIHAPFGISKELLNWVGSNYTYDITVHDYAWLCPRVTLTQTGGRYCGEPDVTQCNRCVATFKPHPGLEGLISSGNGDVDAYKTEFRQLFSKAKTIYAAANDVKNRMQRHGFPGNYRVLPHPVPAKSIFGKNAVEYAKQTEDGLIRVAIIGGLSDIKGFHQVVSCAKVALEKNLPLLFIIFGETLDNSKLSSLENVRLLGKYNDQALDGMVAEHKPSLSLFINQWPETFSYTLSHSFRLCLWPVATDIGAPAERIRERSFGTLFPLGASSDEILNAILNSSIQSADDKHSYRSNIISQTLNNYLG